jgi:hypothetical protein
VSNIPELQAWLKEYVKVRNATVYESVLEKMINIAKKAWKNTYRSDSAKIKSSLSNLPITKEAGGINRKNPQYVGLYKLMNWERKRKGLPVLGNTSKKIVGAKISKRVTRDWGGGTYPEKTTTYKVKKIYGTRSGNFMDGKYKNYLRYRAQSVNWLALGWRAALASLGVYKTKGKDWGGGPEATLQRIMNRPDGGGSQIKKFSPSNTEFMIYNGVGVYDARNKKPYPARSDSDIARARAFQEAGLNIAIQEEIENMAELIADRTSQDWYGSKIKVKAV